MNKYSTLLESTLSRFQRGGFLTGDIVKFRPNAMSNEWAKKQPSNLLQKLKEFAETDKHLRISSVKALRPAVAGSVQAGQQVDDFYCDVVMETAPGIYADFITVPAEILEYQETDINLPELPESLRGKGSTSEKPQDLEIKETDDPMDGAKQVFGDDVKERELTDQNINELPQGQTQDNFNTKQYITGLN